MLIISHRGNIRGPDVTLDNNPYTIATYLSLPNRYCEIDLWKIGDELYIGHDYAKNKIDKTNKTNWLWLYVDKLLIHCKNVDALLFCLQNDYWCFWHENDRYTLTNRAQIVSYPGYAITPNSIVMRPEEHPIETIKAVKPFAICTDYPLQYEDLCK